MDYIKGVLRILGDIEYFNGDNAFYVPNGIDVPPESMAQNITAVIGSFTEFSVEFKDGSYFDLTFNTSNSARGRYEALVYPASCREIKHIYCIYKGNGLHVDLIDAWRKYSVNVNGRDYYLYAPDSRIKDDNLTYRFSVAD